MNNFFRALTTALLTFAALADSCSAADVAKTGAAVDVPVLIRTASEKYQGRFKLTDKQAVAQLDGMLQQQYAAAGSLAGTKDAYLKALYYQAAGLLMNGYPIAGGTLVSIARIQPGFSQSQGGRGLAHFVDAMLAPSDEEDADMVEFRTRASKAQQVLKSLRPELYLVAQLCVMGEIYRDDIAVSAGNLGLDRLIATIAERRVIDAALKAR
jgi:hypothetical protein